VRAARWGGVRECESNQASSGEPASESDGAELDIPQELQHEIREFASKLPELDCYGVLGIPRNATADVVRAAFFERSRRFHPDRYFNKRLGTYASLLHEIYKRVVSANEVLRDPEMRKRYDQSLGKASPMERLLQQKHAPLALPGKLRARPSTGGSLRARKGLRAPTAGLEGLALQLAQSRSKGKRKFEQAKQAADQEDWHEAVRLARLALAFDPRDLEVQGGLADWLPRANEEISRDLVSQAHQALALGEKGRALTALSDAFELRPTDAALARQVADLAVEVVDLQRALQFAECAVALDEQDLSHRKLLGFLYRDLGRMEEARRTLQRVWESNPMDKEVKAALREL